MTRCSPSPFGEYLKKHRERAGLSLRALADIVNVGHVYLGEVERGRHKAMPAKYFKDLAEALPGVTLRDLREAAAISEPLDPRDFVGAQRDLVINLARKLHEQREVLYVYL